MRLKSAITIVTLLPAFLLAACGGSPKSAGSSPPPTADYTWIGRDKVGKALAMLQTGDAAGARKILAAVLDRQPSDAVARSLVKQIDEDPVTLLGSESFAYTTRDGDTFSSLAQRYLGDPMLFYALARYNGVAVPAGLAKGTPLHIPGHLKRETPRPEPRSEAGERSAPVQAKPAPIPSAKPAAPVNDPHRAAQFRAQGLEAMNRGAIARAVVLLDQASRLDPSNALIKRDLDRAIRIKRTVQGR